MTAAVSLDAARVRELLRAVPDPEIPTISVVDLGVIGTVTVDDDHVRVELLPTFIGCPAIDPMRAAIAASLAEAAAGREVTVPVVYDPPWTSDRITAAGRRQLAASGVAPPVPGRPGGDLLAPDTPVACPWCGSRRTVLEHVFGPTACRSVRYCTACRQPFEQFKTI